MAPRAMVSSVQKSSQEGRPCGLLPHPALSLRGSSVTARGQHPASKGPHHQADPSRLGVYWILYQELALGPRNSDLCREQGPGS